MSSERAWVETVKADIEGALRQERVTVATSHRLPYAFHVDSYRSKVGELAVSDPEPKSRAPSR
jgi:hypothetical protein